MTRRPRALAALALLVLALSSLAARPADPPAPAGHWSGAIEVPGAALELDVDLAVKDGAWSGDISIPAQNARDLPLSGVSVQGDAVTFRIEGVPGAPTFAGRLSADGATLSGTMTQGGASLPFKLTRGTDPVAQAKAALAGFDAVVERGLKELHVPGVAWAVVRGDQVVALRGFGVKDCEAKAPVTPDTLFAIGSASKAFTVFALGKLVDEGKLAWDVPLRTYIPWFRLHDETAGERLTPRDFVTHRSGLPRHDLSWYGNARFTREQLVRRLAYLPPSAGLRETWQYNNFGFLTAGYLLETLAGRPWEDAVRSLVFEPLGMRASNFSVRDSERAADFARPYAWEEAGFKRLPFRDISTIGPAGSINSTAREMAAWVRVHLNDGRLGDARLVSAPVVADMHAPHMPIGADSGEAEILAEAYGMGWFTDVYRGHARFHHGGNIDGFSALVSVFPKDGLGFVVLTNLNGTGLPELLVRAAADRILGLGERDWIGEAAKRLRAGEAAARAAQAKRATRKVPGTKPSHPLADYAGAYEHPGYGEVKVEAAAGRLTMTFNGIATPFDHWHYDTFSGAKSDDPTFEDFKLTFRTDADGRVARLEAAFEPAVDPIVFTRRPDARLSEPAYLAAAAGTYELMGRKVVVALRGGSLVLAIPGQPDLDLVPGLAGEYTLKQARTIAVKFAADAAGKVTGLSIYQPEGVFEAKRAGD